MIRRYTHVDERRLAKALKEEASRSEPAYSGLLHARVMQQIAAEGGVPSHIAGRTMPWRWLPLAAAAAMVLGLWIWGPPWEGREANLPSPRLIGQDPRPSIPAVDELCTQVAASAYGRLEAGLKERQLAYLDDDARRLAHFFLDHANPLPPRP